MMPCRFAVHSLSDTSFHIDLFVDTDGKSNLRTFEIGSEYCESLLKIIKNQNPVFYFSELPADSRSIPVVEKKTHRRIYMEFEGKIQENRGNLRHLVYGQIKIIIKNPKYLLVK
ncbi:MAG: hypothetical protein OEZ34_10790 [Spirochaetia bacterium]|nr:hypothetical protein [Spirochaetia bacterium]